MRTTIRIDDQLFRRLKQKAAQTGRTMGRLIEDALREALYKAESPRAELQPLPVYGGSGVMPGVDLASSHSVHEAMDEGADLDALR
jgi:plasmid stability protein